MPLWRCPHCATPQPETSHCWLCGRSTTTCGACRHYRRGVAGGLGLCGKNPRRLALRGSEVLPCWEGIPQVVDPTVRDAAGVALRGRVPAESGRPARTFVPVDELRGGPPPASPAPVQPQPATGPARWSLWGDPDT